MVNYSRLEAVRGAGISQRTSLPYLLRVKMHANSTFEPKTNRSNSNARSRALVPCPKPVT
jgi:hypothetical protein